MQGKQVMLLWLMETGLALYSAEDLQPGQHTVKLLVGSKVALFATAGVSTISSTCRHLGSDNSKDGFVGVSCPVPDSDVQCSTPGFSCISDVSNMGYNTLPSDTSPVGSARRQGSCR
ncbi:hypothetical protein V5799_022520 [Amblyomma americanum]|uniref:Secreted protein n=1 Tax=Amblyomma americanum TaxID=6943 RepID=A0AAQ4FKA2_AMBAM